MNYQEAFFSFFGINPNELSKKVILTNINPIYDGLIAKAEVAYCVSNKGFYKYVEVYFNDEKYALIKVNPGNSIIDVVKLLARYCNIICFMGIAGCLRNDYYSLGDVCSPNHFINLIEIFNARKNKLTICQTNGMINENAFYENLRENGVQLVDMECFDINNVCREYGVELKYVVQISDFPIEIPFYTAKEKPINVTEMLKYIGVTI